MKGIFQPPETLGNLVNTDRWILFFKQNLVCLILFHLTTVSPDLAPGDFSFCSWNRSMVIESPTTTTTSKKMFTKHGWQHGRQRSMNKTCASIWWQGLSREINSLREQGYFFIYKSCSTGYKCTLCCYNHTELILVRPYIQAVCKAPPPPLLTFE